jgi:hypothetical protein
LTGSHLAAGASECAAAHFQRYVDAGRKHNVVQMLDPDAEESISLATSALAPRHEPDVSNSQAYVRGE